ncbi:MAG: hypothetical protein KKA76_02045, partial [Proteobacteria bacterium]|nr:hypothetical protein [Pseudomonadota bacterium]
SSILAPGTKYKQALREFIPKCLFSFTNYANDQIRMIKKSLYQAGLQESEIYYNLMISTSIKPDQVCLLLLSGKNGTPPSFQMTPTAIRHNLLNLTPIKTTSNSLPLGDSYHSKLFLFPFS